MTPSVISFTLNGRPVDVLLRRFATLQAVLREELGHTAPKVGCRQGGCGSCAVLVDGELVLSCLLPAQEAAGRAVETVAALGTAAGGLHPLQAAFVEGFAVQCGYCTPGMLMAAKALLDRNPEPTRDEIVAAIDGQVCRCTGYAPIIDAIAAAARRLAEQRRGERAGVQA